ncbi:sigma-70 family RNA polymerase sigma factor [soil metagenome]
MTDPVLPPPLPRDRTFAEEALPEMDAVYRFALRLSGERDPAEDLVQETFIRAYRSWDSYSPGTRVRSWLFTICRNVFLRREQRMKRHRHIVGQVADEDPARISREATVYVSARNHDPEGAFWSQVVDEEILEAIRDLPPEFREALILADMEDLPYAEIAEVLGIARGTVKSRVFRARRILQERLYEYAVSQGIVVPKDALESTPPAKEGA